jgi:outer membrane protein assembly factor BamD
MKRSVASIAFALLLPLLLLAGCGLSDYDETVGWSAQKLYTEAKSELSSGNYGPAIKLYEKLEARYPFGRYAQQAQLELAYAHFKDNDTIGAVAAADRFIKLHPNHPNVDYAYYLKGIIWFNEDQGILARFADTDPTERDPKAARDSFDAFKELAQRFPDSKYTQDALQRMKWLVNALAAHEVHVARYYLVRGANVAAANRAQYAMQTYPQTPAVEDALFVLVKAYDAMGLRDLRDDAERVMKKNFPRSPYLQDGGPAMKRPWWYLF